MDGLMNSANSFLNQKGNPVADAINNAGGGGVEGEKKEDYLDKAVDFAQEKMGQGQQSDENAVEQQKDEVISDMIRDKYKGFTGNDFPVADK